MPYKVLIVDDFAMARTAFAHIVETTPGFVLAGSIDRAGDAEAFCQNNHVDLALLDVVMPEGDSGLKAAVQLKRGFPTIRILMVTSMPEVSYLQRARTAGVDSFWYKEIHDTSLADVMRRTMEGESIYPDSTPEVRLGNASSTEFTPKELEVLRELTAGATNAEIADSLHIGSETVKMHIANMLQKTGFKNRLELAIKARTVGVVIHE